MRIDQIKEIISYVLPSEMTADDRLEMCYQIIEAEGGGADVLNRLQEMMIARQTA